MMKYTAFPAWLSLLMLVIITSCSTTRNPARDYPADISDSRYPRTENGREIRDRDWEDRERERDRDWKDSERGRRNSREQDQRGDFRRENARSYPFSALDIPKGHLPPPGECKVWLPGKPPGQQPPPQSCNAALRNTPLGAWVVTHEGSRYRVSIFNRDRQNVIDEVRYYLTK